MIIRVAYAYTKVKGLCDTTGFHSHPAHELLICKTGELIVRVKGRTFKIGPGDFPAVPRPTLHSVETKQSNTVFFNALFRGTLFDELQLKLIANL